jgi:hypothetical protein
MKGALLPFPGRRCHIKPLFLSHKTGTRTKLEQELTMQIGLLKHMNGKSCPVILSIGQCRALSLRSRLPKGKKKGPSGIGGGRNLQALMVNNRAVL